VLASSWRGGSMAAEARCEVATAPRAAPAVVPRILRRVKRGIEPSFRQGLYQRCWKARLNRQEVERPLQFGTSMRVTGTGCDRNPLLVQVASLIKLAELFVRLPTMKVGGRIGRISLYHLLESLRGALQISSVLVLHRDTIKRQHVVRILREHRLK